MLFQNKNTLVEKIIFIIAAALCLTPLISPPIALLLGILLVQFINHPFLKSNQKYTSLLLQISIVGLGFGMNITNALKAGKEGFLFTIVSITATIIIGLLLAKLFKVEKKTSYLISTGTAICGGSAIAAVSPIIQAEEKQISVALGIVFILNSIALLVFPYIGELLNLSQTQFGMWCAIAIHDTSSVVGAAGKYGEEALEIATTVKLTRALWIIPVAFISTWVFKNKGKKVKIPYFIGLYIAAMTLNTYVPFVQTFSPYISAIAKAGLTLTLFLIGTGINRKVLESVGLRPFLQGLVLWIIISITSLWVISSFIQ